MIGAYIKRCILNVIEDAQDRVLRRFEQLHSDAPSPVSVFTERVRTALVDADVGSASTVHGDGGQVCAFNVNTDDGAAYLIVVEQDMPPLRVVPDP